MSMNFSVIIPHYNIPNLLIRCLHSIPAREDLEIIVIDDCSPNAQQYKKEYPELSNSNTSFLSTPKGGSAGRARNIGLDNATGKWLIFVDADDLLPDGFNELLNEIEDRKEELVLFNHKSVLSNNLQMISKRDTIYQERIAQYLFDKEENPIRYMFEPLWGKIIRRDLVVKNNIRFDETRWGNDSNFSLQVGIFANNIYVDKRVGYILTEREGSLTSEYCQSVNEISVRMGVALRGKELLKKHNIPLSLSHTLFFDSLIRERFNSLQRIAIAIRLWRFPKYMMHLLLS